MFNILKIVILLVISNHISAEEEISQKVHPGLASPFLPLLYSGLQSLSSASSAFPDALNSAFLNGVQSGGSSLPGSFGVPNTGSFGIPNIGSGGVPNAGSFGVPNAGSFGVPNVGSYGVANAASLGLPNADSFGVPNTGSFGLRNAGSLGQPIFGSFGVPNAGSYSSGLTQLPQFSGLSSGNLPSSLSSLGSLDSIVPPIGSQPSPAAIPSEAPLSTNV